MNTANILSKKDWQLVTFNGNSFDIPYLKRHYDLNELTCDIEKYPSLDFYQFLKPFQNLFQMTHGKQKDWEQFIGIDREDIYSGGDLIQVYSSYRQDLLLHPEQAAAKEHLLLLHNHDDLIGMLHFSKSSDLPTALDTQKRIACPDRTRHTIRTPPRLQRGYDLV